MQAKAIACERPQEQAEPLGRYSLGDIALIMQREEMLSSISRSTLCRRYQQDALKPWRYRNWLFPRDPQFLAKATLVLNLYPGFWAGEALGPDDYLISADEKSGLQILAGRHTTRAPIPGHAGQVEFEYERLGTLVYQAALDVSFGDLVHSGVNEPVAAQHPSTGSGCCVLSHKSSICDRVQNNWQPNATLDEPSIHNTAVIIDRPDFRHRIAFPD